MERKRTRGVASPCPATVVLACTVLLMMMIPEVSSVRYMVGGSKGWTSNVNYTIWAQDKHFYNGDWLSHLSRFSLIKVLLDSGKFASPVNVSFQR